MSLKNPALKIFEDNREHLNMNWLLDFIQKILILFSLIMVL